MTHTEVNLVERLSRKPTEVQRWQNVKLVIRLSSMGIRDKCPESWRVTEVRAWCNHPGCPFPYLVTDPTCGICVTTLFLDPSGRVALTKP